MARILIIDDDVPMRSMLRETFVLHGFDVDCASDGNEGQSFYTTHQYDVIITDIVMPEKDGFEVIMELRKLGLQSKVIAISGGGRVNASDYLQSAKKFGVAEIFQKPINRKQLLAKVQAMCQLG